ncbi:MAG: hypothetical protein E7504_06115 [Ruminococcus sp.]|nr:hypothetical protein [Ruminococcus sp.]
MKRKLLLCLFAVLTALCLCGCSIGVNVDNMLTPPKLSGEQEQIYQALRDATGSAISLKYPKSGSYLSAFLVVDIDGDRLNEAIVFYEKTGVANAGSGLRINVLDSIDGVWKSVCDRSAEGSEIEKVVISKLGDNERMNVIVGYSTANQSEKFVSVYSYEDGYLDLTFSKNYALFDVGKTRDAVNPDLILLSPATTAQPQASAAVYQLDAEGIYHMYNCQFKDSYTDFSQLIYGSLPDNGVVLYVDAATGTATGAAGLQTEILSFDGNRLQNLLELVGRSAKDTVRPAGLYCRDIDNDSVPEIPVQRVFKGYEEMAESEQIPRTDWLMMKDGLLYSEYSSYFSSNDGYTFMLPTKWRGKATVFKDTAADELQIRLYNGSWTEENPVLLRIHISEDEAEIREYLADGFRLIHTKGMAAYLMKAEQVEGMEVSAAELLLCFHFLNG